MSARIADISYHENQQIKGKGSVWIIVCAVTVAVLMGLVGLRFYSLNLEYKLAGIQRQIVDREEEQSRLEKDLASLLNPTRVYSYARSELGMRASANIGLVKVSGSSGVLVASGTDVANGKGIIKAVFSRLVDTITRKASARQ